MSPVQAAKNSCGTVLFEKLAYVVTFAGKTVEKPSLPAALGKLCMN